MSIGRWSIAGVVLAMMMCLAASASAQDPNTHYRIRSRLSNKCLDVSGVSVANGAFMQQWECNVTPQNNQLFNITPTGAGSYRVAALNSARCLDVSGVASMAPHNPIANTANGAQLQQWDCNVNAVQGNQVMSFVASSVPGYFHIKPVHSNRCLDVAGMSMANGALVQQWDCNVAPQDNQLWSLESVGARIPRTNVKMLAYYAHTTAVVGTPGYTYAGDHATGMSGYSFVNMQADKNAGARVRLLAWDPGLVFAANPVYDPNGSYNAHVSSLLAPNRVANWNGFANQVELYVGWAYVAGIELLDEPYWNLMAKGYTASEIHDAIQAATAVIKARVPVGQPIPPVYFVEAVPALNSMLVPSNVDWVGFDCYGPFASCMGASIPTHLATVKSKLAAHQKALLVPWAAQDRYSNSWDYNNPPTAAEIATLSAIAAQYVELALSDPKVAGLLNWTETAEYLQPNGVTQRWVSVLDVPALRNQWRFLGRTLGFGTP